MTARCFAESRASAVRTRSRLESGGAVGSGSGSVVQRERSCSSPRAIENAAFHTQARGSRTRSPRRMHWANASATASLATSAFPAKAKSALHNRSRSVRYRRSNRASKASVGELDMIIRGEGAARGRIVYTRTGIGRDRFLRSNERADLAQVLDPRPLPVLRLGPQGLDVGLRRVADQDRVHPDARGAGELGVRAVADVEASSRLDAEALAGQQVDLGFRFPETDLAREDLDVDQAGERRRVPQRRRVRRAHADQAGRDPALAQRAKDLLGA